MILEGIGLAFATNIITWLAKEYIKPKYGDNGVNFFVFVIALILATGLWLYHSVPTIQLVLITGGQIAMGAITMYQVLWKRIKLDVDVPL